MYWKAANGAGQISRLLESVASPQFPESFSPDGTQLVYGEDADLYVLSLAAEPTSQSLFDSASSEREAAISPDGHWIAYTSNETGVFEIYVRPFPDVEEGKWQISRDGGDEPVWGPDSRELFYRSDGGVMAVSVETEPTFSAGSPTLLFQAAYLDSSGRSVPTYDVSPDGQRFLMMKFPGLITGENSTDVQVHIVSNWFEELNRLAPPSP